MEHQTFIENLPVDNKKKGLSAKRSIVLNGLPEKSPRIF